MMTPSSTLVLNKKMRKVITRYVEVESLGGVVLYFGLIVSCY